MDIISPAMKSIRFVIRAGGRRFFKSTTAAPIAPTKFDYVAHPRSEFFSLGFAKASILPRDIGKKTYYIAGYQDNKPAVGVLDEPHAHAVWIDDNSGHGGVVLVSIDDVGMLSYDVNQIRSRLKNFSMRTGCRSINIVSTHSHAGIDTMGVWGPLPFTGRNAKYMDFLFDTVVKCVEAAYDAREKGRIYQGHVDVEDMQEDIRLPVVYSKALTRLRFVPESGGKEIWILNFASHSESLQGSNKRVSADFPAYMRERIYEETGAETLYCVGCIGGMISMEIKNEREIRDTTDDFAESTRAIGRKLADYALSITDEKELLPKISFIRREFYFEADNTVLLLAAKLGILKAKEYHVPHLSLRHALKSEMSYFEIDTLKILLLPCELFPELAYGGYLTAKESALGLPAISNPKPLAEMAGGDIIFIGLANDEVGYVIPPNDFLLDKDAPYVNHAVDSMGRRHYEETNSLGPKTATKIAAVFKEMLKTVEKTKMI